MIFILSYILGEGFIMIIGGMFVQGFYSIFLVNYTFYDIKYIKIESYLSTEQ